MSGKSTRRVENAAAEAGLEITVLAMPESTRTAEDAARACGCETAQIVKSLIFERSDDGSLVLLLIPGDVQADLNAAAADIGGALTRADPKKVRAETGFAIGGVAPLGHLHPLPVFMHTALLAWPSVWAAAGSPRHVFSVDPKTLKDAVGAHLLTAPPGTS